MLYSKASSSDAEEELISASASDSRDCRSIFSNGGRTAIGKSSMSTEVVGESFFSFFLFLTTLKSGKSGEANASSLTGTTDGEDGIGKLVIGGDAFAVEPDGLEQETAEASGFLWTDGSENDFFATET
ncbi:hypothetical protein AVEN_107114-1 [Araneus ventricosus]|uniref:Uncharacterized protein n=1 Tax=Araneus ventricosus TaxID=182803 RepID=A0A4Y2C6M3_ARAVE|nr:hypothetical protein AVEN_107114-1 [Araneus ventricosus]